MEYDLTRVHQAALEILKEIDRICRKYGIKYMLDAGTLLGAVRHKGFIPWDDDADVAMTRRNYEAFVKAAVKELPENMTLIMPGDYRSGKAFYDFTPRIIYNNSRTREDSGMMEFYEGKLNHLWVDIFILDRLPKSRPAAELAKLYQKAVYGMAMGHRYALDYSRYSPLHKLYVGVLANAGKLVPMQLLFKIQDVLAVKDWKRETGLWYYSNYQPDYLYVTLKEEWCGETVDLEFEGEKLMCPKGWHEVLTWIYGDYMTPPPEEQQVPAHSDMEIEIYE